jgi:hypothetical protein
MMFDFELILLMIDEEELFEDRRLYESTKNILSLECERVKALGACRRTRSGFERPFFRLAASGCIDDKTNIACFAVFASRKNCSLSGRRRSSPTDSQLLQTA